MSDGGYDGDDFEIIDSTDEEDDLLKLDISVKAPSPLPPQLVTEAVAKPKKIKPKNTLSAKDKKLEYYKMKLLAQFGKVGEESGLPRILKPNHVGPKSMLADAMMGRKSVKDFHVKPEVSLSIDVGERCVGAEIRYTRNADDPSPILFLDNINLFPVTPIDVEYLHGVYNTTPLPTGCLKWDDAHSIESILQEDLEMHKLLTSNVMAASLDVQKRLKKISTDAIVAPPTSANADTLVPFKRKSKKKDKKNSLIKTTSKIPTFLQTSARLNKIALETFFDTSKDRMYTPNGELNRSEFAVIPHKVEDLWRILSKSLTIYTRYWKELVGHIDVVFIECQEGIFGMQGKLDQFATENAIKVVFPEPETHYEVIDAEHKLRIYPLDRDDIRKIASKNHWKSKYFRTCGPSGRLVYKCKSLPASSKDALKRFDDIGSVPDEDGDENDISTFLGVRPPGAKKTTSVGKPSFPDTAQLSKRVVCDTIPKHYESKKRKDPTPSSKITCMTILDDDDEDSPPTKRQDLVGRSGYIHPSSFQMPTSQVTEEVKNYLSLFGVETTSDTDSDIFTGSNKPAESSTELKPAEDEDDDALLPLTPPNAKRIAAQAISEMIPDIQIIEQPKRRSINDILGKVTTFRYCPK